MGVTRLLDINDLFVLEVFFDDLIGLTSIDVLNCFPSLPSLDLALGLIGCMYR
jgi:hypothetical protein